MEVFDRAIANLRAAADQLQRAADAEALPLVARTGARLRRAEVQRAIIGVQRLKWLLRLPAPPDQT